MKSFARSQQQNPTNPKEDACNNHAEPYWLRPFLFVLHRLTALGLPAAALIDEVAPRHGPSNYVIARQSMEALLNPIDRNGGHAKAL